MEKENHITDYKLLKKLANDKLNLGLLSHLENQVQKDIELLSFQRVRLNLYRKLGDLQSAQQVEQDLLNESTLYNTPPLNNIKLNSLEQLQRREFKSCPLFVLDDVFPIDVVQQIYTYVVSRESSFSAAGVGYDSNTFNETKRDTLMLSELGPFASHFNNLIEQLIPFLTEWFHLGLFIPGRIEMKYTNHVNGGFFHIHSDNKKSYERKGRAITWLYYFYERPKAFKGGELLVFDSSVNFDFFDQRNFAKINPNSNRFVAFPSAFYHTVMPVIMEESIFSKGRMAVTGHIHYGN